MGETTDVLESAWFHAGAASCNTLRGPMELRAKAVHQEGMRFVVTAGSHSLTTDYPLDAVDPAIVATALAQSEELICPVWAMLKPGTTLTSSFRIDPLIEPGDAATRGT